jgi:cell division protein FtsI/penicillin-binding protein 2
MRHEKPSRLEGCVMIAFAWIVLTLWVLAYLNAEKLADLAR